MQLKAKKAQLTIFLVVAILIIALFASIFFLVKKPKTFSTKTKDPRKYLEECILNAIKEIEPFIEMNINENTYFSTSCGQRIFLFTKAGVSGYCDCDDRCIKNEIALLSQENKSFLNRSISSCIKNVTSLFESKGYATSSCSEQELEWNYSLINDRFIVKVDCPITIEKKEKMRISSIKVVKKINASAIWPSELKTYRESIENITKIECEDMNLPFSEDITPVGEESKSDRPLECDLTVKIYNITTLNFLFGIEKCHQPG